MKKRILASMITASLILSPVTVYAIPSAQEVESARSDMEKAISDLSSINERLDKTTEKLQYTQYLMGKKKSEISKTEKELKIAKKKLSKHLYENYKHKDEMNLINLLLDSKTFEEFSSNLHIANAISSKKTSIIEQTKALEDRLGREYSELSSIQEKQKKNLESLQSQSEEYQNALSAAKAQYEKLSSERKEELARQAEEERSSSRRQVMEDVTSAPVSNPVRPAETTRPSVVPSRPSNRPQNETSHGSIAPKPKPKPEVSDKPIPKPSIPQNGGLSAAYKLIGTPYVWGGTNPYTQGGVDCSGLICYCYGYRLGRTTYDMIDSLKGQGRWKTSMNQLNVGDLVFPSAHHVGIYVGGGKILHAPKPGDHVKISTLWSFYGGGTY